MLAICTCTYRYNIVDFDHHNCVYKPSAAGLRVEHMGCFLAILLPDVDHLGVWEEMIWCRCKYARHAQPGQGVAL